MPAHVPVVVLSVIPSTGDPEMTRLGACSPAPSAAVTTAVCAESGFAKPSVFVTVTSTRSVEPTSSVTAT